MAGSMLSFKAARALAILLALVSQISIASCEAARRADKSHWVDIWGSMPQLVEYTNMPPVPFVSFLTSNLAVPRPLCASSPLVGG